MKSTDLNEALAEPSIAARGDLVSRRHIHSVEPTDRREGRSCPRQLEVTPNAAAAFDFTLTEGGEAGTQR
ncbi:MAG TPA: hypothetical protein VK355_10040 [Candidatus Binatia bacterium]|nr:hypothetical protein [Candidatus Binatia bacterium]